MLLRNISQDPDLRERRVYYALLHDSINQLSNMEHIKYKTRIQEVVSAGYQDQDTIIKKYARLYSSVEGEFIRRILPGLALQPCNKDRHKAREKHRYDINHRDEQTPPLPSKLSMPDY
ncbi:hypothetical protein LSAT2_010766 [Lamellibrachia satsuma]|nr:hypothetical protein LSAT2_010766 [Lamellibrachia satsuma]